MLGVPGVQYLEYSAWSTDSKWSTGPGVPGVQYLEYSTWNTEPGVQYLEYRTWSTVPGVKYLEYIPCSTCLEYSTCGIPWGVGILDVYGPG